MNLGERIKKERERLGHTQEEWASHTGVHRNTQAKYEKGDAVPDINYLSAIDELGADIGFVLTGEKTIYRTLSDEQDAECLMIEKIVELTEDAIMRGGYLLSNQKKARVISMLYRSFIQHGDVDKAVINDAVKLAAV